MSAKLRCPEFCDFLNQYEIIGLQESKTDDTDSIVLPGYTCFLNNRDKLSRYRSGGIALFVKNSISDYIKVENEFHSKLILWFIISHKITLIGEDVHCGIVYIPPQGSKYAHEEPYNELEQEIIRYCINSTNIILMGDFNSRSGQKDDYVSIGSYLSKNFGLEQLCDDFSDVLNNFELNSVPLLRENDDSAINSYGNLMLDFCKNTNLFIANGRLGKVENSRRVTCKDRSTVDYYLCTSDLFSTLQELQVHEFNCLYSDAHSPLTVVLKTINIDKKHENKHEQTSRNQGEKTKLWDPDKSHLFSNNLNSELVSEIDQKISHLLNSNTTIQSDIDKIVGEIGVLFEESAKNSFGYLRPKNNKKSKFSKPWFNFSCRKARNVYHIARKLYNKNKSETNRIRLKQVSKEYKSTLYKNQKQYKNVNINKLRNLKTSNPREYWRILNSHQTKQKTEACLDDLYNYFKNINESGQTSNDPNNIPTFDSPENQELNEELNLPITEAEILKAINGLKCNKSSGLDNIKNEHIKNTCNTMLPIYCKLFNIIFDTGIIPESWSLGTIKPIFKNKGDPKQPENYRPITILSCFGKLFTSVINNRLKTYADEYGVIDDCQAGFRKNYSTADNMFIIKSLIDIARASKKKLHCCFIDFKQAFDTVWRDGLWGKLLHYQINGKCFKIIRSIYENIKSNVEANGSMSAFFKCLSGLRQGENMSPFLFSIFLNDLKGFLRAHNVNGITCNIGYEDISVYLKIVILLFADDTVLFAESDQELQYVLDQFQEYCEEMKLTVNVSKTKIVIYTNSRNKNNITYKFNASTIEIVDAYKYLGIYFAKNGSFTLAKKNVAEQANKALFSLLRKARNLDLPYDIQLDLFNKMIKPILLYGSEIWGTGNCDILERVQLKFLKYTFKLKKSTPSHMIYGELGIMPISSDIKTRFISFWCKLIENYENFKLSSHLYKVVHAMHEHKYLKSAWIDNIKHLLCSLGFSGIWYTQSFISSNWLIKATKQKIKDIYIQDWNSTLSISSSSNNYRLFKDTFEASSYISTLSTYMCRRFLAFRTRNHRFPVEIGRWRGQPLHERKCKFCLDDIGDEYHYLLTCRKFTEERKRYIKPYFFVHPNTIKYHEIMNTKNPQQLKNLCKFLIQF